MFCFLRIDPADDIGLEYRKLFKAFNYNSYEKEEAIDLILKSAKQGFPQAQRRIGEVYYDILIKTGDMTIKGHTSSIGWYLRAKARDVNYEKFIKGPYLYYYGVMSEKADGIELIENYKDEMPDIADVILEWWYHTTVQDGIDCKDYEDYPKKEYNSMPEASILFLLSAAEKGYCSAEYGLYWQYRRQGDHKTAFTYLNASATHGFLRAQWYIGSLYKSVITGRDSYTNDENEYSQWYQRMEENEGHFEKYVMGTGLIKNGPYNLAADGIKLIEKCRSERPDIADYYLGYAYYYGRGVKKDRARAFELFRSSADKNYLPAFSFLMA